ncbi:hypothetical protein Tco_0634334, partial [Tanacetum coccineum]
MLQPAGKAIQPGGWMNFGGRRGNSQAAVRRAGQLAQIHGLVGLLSGLARRLDPSE